MKRWLDAWLPKQLRAHPETQRAVAGVVVLWIIATVLAIFKREDWPEAAARFAARGNSMRVELVALGWIWKALVVNVLVLGGLLLTVRWWAVPRVVIEVDQPQGLGRRSWLSFGVAVLVVLVAALAVRLPRMNLSLYNDEAHNYARLWSGTWQDKQGQVMLKVPRWGETWFLNQAGNNSQPYSVAARACLEAGARLGWRVPGEVSEWLARLPALVAGLLTIGLLGATMGRTLGGGTGMAVMLALALHPWHVRYSTEARGYALMILGISIMLWFAVRGTESGRWRHWLGYGAGVWLTAAAFLGSIYFLACFSGVLLMRQVMEWRHRQDPSLVWRPLIASLLAALTGMVTLLPLVPQLLEVLEQHDSIRGTMGLGWWKDVAGYLMAGVRWIDGNTTSPVNLALSRWAGAPVGTAAITSWLIVMVSGVVVVMRRGGVARLLLLATPLAVGLAWALMARRGNYLNHWYLLYAVPAVVTALGTGMAALMTRGRGLGGLVVVLGLVLPGSLAWSWRGLPKQEERAPVWAVFGASYPRAADINRDQGPMLAAFWCNATLYHPAVVALRDRVALEALMARANSEDRELHVCFSHRGPALQHDPDLIQHVERSGLFEQAGLFWGQEESQFNMHWYRLKPRREADAGALLDQNKSVPR